VPSDVRYEVRGGAVLVPVKVVPGASRSRVVGPLGDRLKVAVAAPPERGAANEEVERLLAERLGVPASSVRVVSGHADPRKTVAVPGTDAAAVRKALEDGGR
jgi:uncharacterized protein (TIGR00251 family)